MGRQKLNKLQINMKIQARISAFETNSSTNHTLCIVKPDGIPAAELYASVPDEITIPCFTGADAVERLDEIERNLSKQPVSSLPFGVKVTLLAISFAFSYDTHEFIGFMLLVQNILEEFGVKYEIDWRAMFDIVDHRQYAYDFCELFSELSEEEARAFILSSDCRYAVWCDECCREMPDEYSAVVNHVEELRKTDPDGFYVINERC